MSRRYPEALHDFLRSYIPGHTAAEISTEVRQRFNIEMTANQVKSYKQNHGIKSGTVSGVPAGAPTKLYPAEVIDYITKHYKGLGPIAMAEQLNKVFGTTYTRQQLKAFYNSRHLDSGLSGYFTKGHVPPNKGKKGMTMHPNAIAAQFKAGHKPFNKLPIGTVLEKTDGYLWRKTGEGCRDWKQEHILRWEEANGPLPEGGRLTFLDGDRHNVELSNLALIDNAINLTMMRKRLRSKNPELTKTGILVAKLSMQTKERTKGGKNGARQDNSR